MNPNVHEWLHLLLRWFHIIAGIMWIGDSFYFMWLDSHLTQPDPARERVTGELWMTHSGGFYRVEKRQIGPGTMPPKLYWFWSEATMTWISGFFLLGIVYYMGGMLLGSTSTVNPHLAPLIGLGSLVAGVLVYNLIWLSPLGASTIVGGIISFAALVGASWELSQVFSGRAAFMHVGAILGTIMVSNVWFIILPAQAAMIKATEEGREPDVTRGKKAKIRSIHNNYMTLPVIFVMLSNHFPTLYGKNDNWLILMLLFVASMSIRYWMNKRTPESRIGLVVGIAMLAGLVIYTTPPATPSIPVATSSETPVPTAPAEGLHGIAHFDGTPPAPEMIKMAAGCELHGPPEVPNDRILIKNGVIQNVFVWVSKGVANKKFPVPPEIKMDQKGCLYVHHVIGLQVGQKVTFVNYDELPHNVRVASKKGDLFNTMMPSEGDTFTQAFTEPEQMLHARCDIHPWMSAYIGVVSNPYYAVTDAQGQFSIKGLPAGPYTLQAWHEVFGQQSQDVTVGADGTASADFTFKAK